MMKAFLSILSVLFLSCATIAFGFADAQFLMGYRSGKYTDQTYDSNLKATEITIAAHLDPIPLVPIAFGLRGTYATYDGSVSSYGFKSMTSYSFIPEVIAWLPLGNLQPYGRLGYSLATLYYASTETYFGASSPHAVSGQATYRGNGPHIGAGLKYSLPVPLLSLISDLSFANESIRPVSKTAADLDITDSATTPTYPSTAIAIGVELGL